MFFSRKFILAFINISDYTTLCLLLSYVIGSLTTCKKSTYNSENILVATKTKVLT